MFPPAMLEAAGTARHPFGDEQLVRTRGKDLSWNIHNITKDKYYIRLLVQSGNKSGEDEFRKKEAFLFLNGKKVNFNRATPLTFSKGTFYAIIQSAAPVMLKNGDRLRLNRARQCKFGTLALDKNKLNFTPIWLPKIFGPYKDDIYRVSAKFGKDFSFKIINMTGSENKINVSCRILDYFGTELASKDSQKLLKNTAAYILDVPFKRGASDRYRAIVTISDNKNNRIERVFATLANRSASFRPKIWLNKNWQWTSLKDDYSLKTRTLQALSAIPPKAIWRTVTLPANWKEFKRNDHVAFFKKTFNAPGYMRGRRFFIHFDRILYEADIYLNGKKVAHKSYSAAGPFEVEVSKFIKTGKNTLTLCVRDRTAALLPSELAKKHLDLTPVGKLRAPIGLRPGVGEIYLYNTPQQIIGDIFVKTSFRKKTLELELQIPQKGNFTVSNRILLRGKEVFSLANAKSRGGKLNLSATWDKPILWGPVKFPLLQLETMLKNSSGKILDVKNTRFGFREIWSDKMKTVWNGKEVKFGSRPFLQSWSWNITSRNKRDKNRRIIRLAKLFGCKMLRHVYNSNGYSEIADEEGILITQGVQSVAHHTKQQINSNEFWKNIYKNAASMILGLRNHPSIFTWYLSNEYYGESEKRNGERLRVVGEQVLKLDNSRFIEFGCDLDLRGFTKIISVHYPVDVRAFRTASTYLPEAAYWRYFRQKFYPGMKVPAGMSRHCANVYGESPMTWGRKPIIVNETCWVSFLRPPYGLTRIFSDEVFTSPFAIDYAHGLANIWFTRGHRDADVSAITLWKQLASDPNSISIPELDVNILQRYNKFYAGTVIDYDINISHERFADETLNFSCRLLRDGKTIWEKNEKIRFDFCQLTRRKIKLTMPEVSKTTSLKLVAGLYRSGKALKEYIMPISVYPRANGKLKSSMLTGLFKCPQLGSLIKNTRMVKSLQQLNEIELLILGENIPSEILKKHAEQLNKFVADGGKVLILNQNKPLSWLPVGLQCTDRTASINYSFRPKHPLLRDISGDEMKFWYPGHKAAVRCWLKPDKGNFRNIIEAGGPFGLKYVSLLEIPHGKGVFMCSQLDLSGYEKNPVARKLWKNILNYSRKEKALTPIGYLGLPGGKLVNALKRIGVVLETVNNSSDIGKYRAVIWDPQLKLNKKMATILKQYANNGGNLLIHGIAPSNVEQVSKVSAKTIKLSQERSISWQGRAVRRNYSPIVAGLNNQDLFWKKTPESEDYYRSYYSSKEIESPLGEWQLAGQGIDQLIYPALLAEIPLGKGRIILDNLSWTSAETSIRSKATRIASILLTNLGVKIQEHKKANFENLTYRPLDISRYFNRGFTDPVDQDGKGGWSDQGPKSDMSNFKLKKGVHTFNKVPFIINRPKGCLVLYSKYRRGAPEKMTIAVNRKADALFFLQSSAWTSSKHHASYFINYDDGTKAEIQLIGGINLRDWGSSSPEKPFSQETETTSSVAIKVPHKRFGFGSIYQMGWANPYPKRTIKNIDFVSRKIGVPILVGITTGTRKTAQKAIVLTASQKKIAAQLNRKAEKLIDAGKYTGAEKLLKQAQIKAPGDHATCINLGYVYRELKQYRKSIFAFRQALKSKPQELEPYLQIAKCYESLGDYTNAIKVYRESLAKDINQPDIIAALDAVKKKQEK